MCPADNSPVVRVHRVTFAPMGWLFDVVDGRSLLWAARRARVPIASSCRGNGVCRACRVRVLEGMPALSPPTVEEMRGAQAAGLADDERLACLARVHGPVTITTSYW